MMVQDARAPRNGRSETHAVDETLLNPGPVLVGALPDTSDWS